MISRESLHLAVWPSSRKIDSLGDSSVTTACWTHRSRLLLLLWLLLHSITAIDQERLSPAHTLPLLVFFHQEIPGDEVSGRRNTWLVISHTELAIHKHENLNQKLHRKKSRWKVPHDPFCRISSFPHLWPPKAENYSSQSFWGWSSLQVNVSSGVGSGEVSRHPWFQATRV